MFDAKARYVRSLFSNVPLEYDILLSLLSFGQDKRWRAFVVNQARPRSNERILDVATGTGLLAADFARIVSGDGSVVGLDLTLSMLKTARWRLQSKGLGDKVDWVLARAENLPFRDNCFASASISLAPYLGRSILKARTGEQIANLLIEEGLADAVSVPLTAGSVCAVYGKKR